MSGKQKMPKDTKGELRKTPVYVAIDLDRVLLDTDVYVQIVCTLMSEHGVSEEEVLALMRDVLSNNGQSISLLRQLRDNYGDEPVALIKQEALKLAHEGALDDQGLLHDGAAELHKVLQTKDVPHGILTYGASEDQAFKLALVYTLMGIDEQHLPYKITQEKYKSQLIAAHWRTDDEDYQFVIPEELTVGETVVAQHVVVIDDKIANFTSNNPQIRSIYINNYGETSKGQRRLTEVVSQLKAGHTLYEISREAENFDS